MINVGGRLNFGSRKTLLPFLVLRTWDQLGDFLWLGESNSRPIPEILSELVRSGSRILATSRWNCLSLRPRMGCGCISAGVAGRDLPLDVDDEEGRESSVNPKVEVVAESEYLCEEVDWDREWDRVKASGTLAR